MSARRAVSTPTETEPATEEVSPPQETGSRRSEMRGLLVGLPLAVLVIGGIWAVWRETATLDDIEQRTLAWSNIAQLAGRHLWITAVSTVIVCVVAIPLGILVTRPHLRRYAGIVVAVANAGQAAPAVGLLVLFAMWLGFDTWTAVAALSLYAILPVLQNTVTGLRGIDATLLEAARGIGMSRWEALLRVELPLAIAVIMAGIRTALVLLVGTATLATFVNAGGLGQLIQTGITLFRFPVLISGALLVALLALLVDWAGRVLETALSPKGLR